MYSHPAKATLEKPVILLVEDEPELAQLLSLNLNALNYQVLHSASLASAKQTLNRKHVDLVLMDRMLPDGDGLTLCQQWRNQDPQLAIMLITAKDSEADRVLGLEAGADDYLVKPFSVLELRARVKALLRRSLSTTPANEYELNFGPLIINAKQRQVTLNHQTIELTAREFDLIWHLASHPQQVFSREQLLDSVWGYHHAGYEHTVNSHVNRLRAKLHPFQGDDFVKTVWGVGYKFEPLAGAA
ncbi:response regulator transcription factor [Paraferrimonas sedimenticola]|uniref:Phosphate regulon transcriptional regulatory protein PhoB n=1 Tax=Paraferrimonas sedimenticola TaxID=375674 RepID=A0AA37VVQ9_9GAMM|nr:response regulator transcription factor [Paraferrimonas sedimenticola]GLP96189.1 DNA-binding response regulator [Paraferrimonas sedimenticola]